MIVIGTTIQPAERRRLTAPVDRGVGSPSNTPEVWNEPLGFRVFRGRERGPFEALSPDVGLNSSRSYVFRDPAPEVGRCIYRVGEVGLDGTVVLLGSVEIEVERVRRVTMLHPALPNPFNPATVLRFELARDDVVRLDILDVRGRIVRSLVRSERTAAGPHRVMWDGRDDGGRRVRSGVYEARLRAGGRTLTRSVTLVK
jgi:hypothetical protein